MHCMGHSHLNHYNLKVPGHGHSSGPAHSLMVCEGPSGCMRASVTRKRTLYAQPPTQTGGRGRGQFHRVGVCSLLTVLCVKACMPAPSDGQTSHPWLRFIESYRREIWVGLCGPRGSTSATRPLSVGQVKSHAWDTGITTVRFRSMDVREGVGESGTNLVSGPRPVGTALSHRAVTAYTRCWSTETKIFLSGWSGERSKVCSHPSDVCRGGRAPRDVWTNLSARSRNQSKWGAHPCRPHLAVVVWWAPTVVAGGRSHLYSRC